LSRENDVATKAGPINAVGEVAEHVVQAAAAVLTKPRARGWIHLVSAIVALVAGATLIAVSWPLAGPKAGLATFVYTVSVVGMFTVSAIYHRVTWKSASARMWMKRLDHSMIFVLIAGTYTPFALLAMPHHAGMLALSIVWGGAVAGVLLDVLLDAVAREVVRVQFMAGRHGFGAGERAVFVEQVPAAAHDHEHGLERFVRGGFVQFEPVGIALTPKDIVEKPVGLDQLFDHLLLPGIESFGVKWHLNSAEFGENSGYTEGRE